MNAALDRLLGMQRADGGWSAGGGGPSATETTALAAMALRNDGPRASSARERALEWLRAGQRADGSWAPAAGISVSGWMTSLVVIALADSTADRSRAVTGARWLLDQEGRGYAWLTRLFFRLFPGRVVIDLDPDLTGWPWFPGTFSWIEPTAWALIALKSLREELPGDLTSGRIHEAERMILDRSCVGGGWNYGNSRVYDEDLWPYPDTTALALISLQDRPDLPEVAAGLSALARMLEENGSVLATSLGLLCFRLFGREDSALRERLSDRLEASAWVDTRALALATMALDPVGTFSVAHA